MEKGSENNESQKMRPFMANVSMNLEVPENMSDEEVIKSLVEMKSTWTSPKYSGYGPNGPIVDPSGWDVEV
ncbi:MAG: hypothetical protein AAFQ14_13700 [Cyanobacteria bacterium J06621_12]